MARPLRIEYPGAFYHVTSRGNAKGDIFLTMGDRFKFLTCLSSAAESYSLLIHAYCLMGNHYHLMAETPLGNLAQAMHQINTAYTVSFNLRNDRVGHLFQGRYKSILLESEAYALEVSRYIHLNPIRAELTHDPFAYPWSSLGAYTGKRVAPDWLRTDYLSSFFRGPEGRKKLAYRKFVLEGLEKSKRNPFEDTVACSILGREPFVDDIRKRFLSDHEDISEIPASKQLAKKPPFSQKPSISLIVDAVERTFAGQKRIKRQAKIFFCCRYSGARRKAIGEYFKISGAGVAMSIRRFAGRVEHDEELRVAVKKVENILNC